MSKQRKTKDSFIVFVLKGFLLGLFLISTLAAVIFSMGFMVTWSIDSTKLIDLKYILEVGGITFVSVTTIACIGMILLLEDD